MNDQKRIKLDRRNAYFCPECRKVTITVDVDPGVTPMFIKCPHFEISFASSFMYQVLGCMAIKYSPNHGCMVPFPADYEWYKPDKKQKLSADEKDHVDQGGLLMRKRTNKEPIYRD